MQEDLLAGLCAAKVPDVLILAGLTADCSTTPRQYGPDYLLDEERVAPELGMYIMEQGIFVEVLFSLFR